MNKPFEARGFWHLPNVRRKEVPGTLSFHPKEGFRLALLGTFGDEDFFTSISSAFSGSDGDNVYQLIRGVVDKSPFGTHFTLVDCFRLRASFDFSGSPRETILVNRAFAGAHHIPEEDSTFSEVAINYTYLQDWLGQSGVTSSIDTDDDKRIRGITIRCVPVPPREFSIEGAEINFKVTWSTRQESCYSGASVNESAIASIRLAKAATAGQILRDVVGPLQDLITLGINHPNFVTQVSLSGLTGGEPGDSFRFLYVPIDIGDSTDKPKKIFSAGDMLLSMSDFDELQGDVLRKWFEFRARRADFCDLFFSSLYSPPRFIDQRFESVATALSLLLDDDGGDTTTIGGFDDSFRTAFWEAMSDKLGLENFNKQWVNDILPSRAELLFAPRLRTVLDRYSNVLDPIAPLATNEFVDSVSTTMAYTRMRCRDSRSSSLHDSELLSAITHLEIVCKILMLEKLGASIEIVQKLLNRNWHYGVLRRNIATATKLGTSS